MDIIAIAPTQQLLWILLLFLLAWMIIFAWLAIRRSPEASVEREEKAYSQPLSAKTVATALHIEAAKQTQTVAAKHEQPAELYLERSVR